MRIEQLEYWDKARGWHLSPATSFFPDLTLLVGVSGAGKTQILRAIRQLRGIARDINLVASPWGVSWSTTFFTTQKRYTCSGEFETPENPVDYSFTELGILLDSKASPLPTVLKEKLLIDGETVIDRDRESIRFQGKLTPKLPPFKSALAILQGEDSIRPVIDGFDRMTFLDQDDASPSTRTMFRPLPGRFLELRTLASIQASPLSISHKLAILFANDKERFDLITSRFREIFPVVEDVSFARVTTDRFGDMAFLQVKERGVDQWIPENYLASGMWRTLIHLASVVLCPEESVILIDEFENSLGVNCLDDVTADMMDQSRRLQFIVTSHHPYIINNIPPKHWKVVVRQGGRVTTLDAAALGIGKSKHEAFIQLINSQAYREGVAAP
jgi:hypothetical protein